MISAETIAYISVVFWLLPPFRQFKGRFFYYFLIMALSDPINIFCVEEFRAPLYTIHSIAGLFLIFSLTFNQNGFKKKLFLALSLFFVFIWGMIYFENHLYFLLTIHSIIFLILLKIAILPIYQENTINIFYFALLFYELSIVLNLSLIMGGSNIKMLLFYMTLSIQVLMAIFFTIFTEKSEILLFHLSNTDSS